MAHHGAGTHPNIAKRHLRPWPIAFPSLTISLPPGFTRFDPSIAQVTVPSFYSIISNDEDTLKIVVQIMNGMSASAAELQKYLSYWDKYKYIWESDKVRRGHRLIDRSIDRSV